MSEVRWPDLKELLADALEVEPAQRRAYVKKACGDDVELRRQLEELLAYENEDEPGDAEPEVEEAAADVARRGRGERWMGAYRLLEPIGEGGMGTVFKAEQRYPVKRLVAIKLIKPGYDTEEVIARFESERQALARMDHGGIARVLDAGADDRGRPYFVMEYVPGVPITRFADEAKLTINQRLELFTQVCEAIAHAHTKGIIHRDLKPSNILAHFADGQPVVKTIDFGIAKALSGDRLTDHTFDTSRGKPIGTYEAMSPEQAAASVDIDTRSDVYSLGVLLYELLSGTRPFERSRYAGADDQEIRRIIREIDPARPSHQLRALGPEGEKMAAARGMGLAGLERQLRSELEWIPLMAMRKDRARRYAGVLELAADVRNYLENRPLVAGPESRVYRLRKFERRNRAAVLMMVAFMVVVGAFVGSYIRGIRSEQKKTQAALELVQKKHLEAGAQRDEARRQQQNAAAVNRFLGDMLRSADPKRLYGDKVTVLEAIQAAMQALDRGEMDDQPMVEAALRETIGNTLAGLGRFNDAEPNFRKALELRQKVLPPNDPEVAAALNHMGVFLRSQRKFYEAERVHREALKIRVQKLPPGDPAIAVSLGNLASALQGQDRNWHAEPLYRQALEIQRRAFPTAHPDLAESIDSLAGILRNLKNPEAAQPLAREALAMRRLTLERNHPDLANTIQTLAVVLRDQGNYAEAEKLSREALAIYEEVMPPDHLEIITSVLSLAKVLKLQKKFEEVEPLLLEARAMLERAIDQRRNQVERNAPDLANHLHLLAQMYAEDKEWDEAQKLLTEGLEVTEKARPLDKFNLARAQCELGGVLEAQKKWLEAEQMYQKALANSQAVLPEDDPAIVKHLQLVGRILRRQKRYEEAAQFIRKAVYINRKSIPAGHPHMAGSISAQARIEYSLGDVELAKTLQRESIELSRRAKTREHSDIARRLSMLGEWLWAEGKLDEAEELLREAVEMDRNAIEVDGGELASDLLQLGRVQRDKKKPQEAVLLMREALQIQLEELGVGAKATRQTIKDLRVLLAELGRHEEAAKLRELRAGK
jgi:eukaryotic-like serine/threonine-protein kinase